MCFDVYVLWSDSQLFYTSVCHIDGQSPKMPGDFSFKGSARCVCTVPYRIISCCVTQRIFFCHLDYAFIRSWPLRKSMYLYLVSLRCFFRIIFYRSRLFGNRCNTAGCFPEEGTVCNFLDQSFWDRSSFGQRMMISFWDRSSFGQRVVSVEVDETESTWRFVIFTKKGGSGGRDIKDYILFDILQLTVSAYFNSPPYLDAIFLSPIFLLTFSVKREDNPLPYF